MNPRICLMVLVVLSLTACAAPIEAPMEATRSIEPTIVVTPAPSTAIPEPTKKVWTYQDMTVLFLAPYTAGDWHIAYFYDFKKTAEALDINLKVVGPCCEGDQENGFASYAFNEEVDVIVLSANDPSNWEDGIALEEARAMGKVIILAYRPLNVPEDLYDTYIGSDFVEEGRKAGNEMCKLLEGSETKHVWEVTGKAGSDFSNQRGQGFHEVIGDCGIEVSKSQTGDWIKEEGERVIEAWLKESSDVDGIFAHNDEMALGAIEALKEAGIAPGDDVKIVSIDASAAAFEAMLVGELNATVECNPLYAHQVFEAALKALNGEELPKFIPTEETVFYADMPNLEEIAAGRTW